MISQDFCAPVLQSRFLGSEPVVKKAVGAFRYGILAEYMAVRYFRNKGYRVLARRFKTRYGEVDLVLEQVHVDSSALCNQKPRIVFVEVKARRSTFSNDKAIDFWNSQLLSMRQIVRCKQAIECFFSNTESAKYLNHECSFDLIVIRNTKILHHFENILS